MIEQDQYVELMDMATGETLEGYVYELGDGEVQVSITWPVPLQGIIETAAILPMPVGHMGLVVIRA